MPKEYSRYAITAFELNAYLKQKWPLVYSFEIEVLAVHLSLSSFRDKLKLTSVQEINNRWRFYSPNLLSKVMLCLHFCCTTVVLIPIPV